MNALLGADKVAEFVHGLDHPEGIAWGMDGFIYAGGEGGQIYRIAPSQPEAKVIANTGGFLLGLALDGAHNVYACDAKHAVVQRITPAGRVTTYSAGAPGEPFLLPNYPVFDRQGNLYVSCYRPDAIYRYTPQGEFQLLAEDFEGTVIAAPTNIAFCGKNRDLLLSANIGRWHLTRYDLDAVGLPLNYPSLPRDDA